MKPQISVGVFAYNESSSLLSVLKNLANQKITGAELLEIYAVVDEPDEKLQKRLTEISQEIPKIKLSFSKKRVGKSGAINRFFNLSKGNYLVFSDADNIIYDCLVLDKLIQPLLKDSTVGIAGCHAVPEVPEKGFYSFIGQKIWSMHHQIAVKSPKICGNFYALKRDAMAKVPEGLINDDVFQEFNCQRLGFKKHYSANAIIGIKVPDNFRDFFQQRLRIHLGYKQLKKLFPSYKPATFKFKYLINNLFRDLHSFKDLICVFGMLFLHLMVIISCQLYPYKNRKDLNLWPVIESTKF
jgi:cellulose synthase/poly-beta-1,6-N-acetylglucosamine synthase-like glycosyltransferase